MTILRQRGISVRPARQENVAQARLFSVEDEITPPSQGCEEGTPGRVEHQMSGVSSLDLQLAKNHVPAENLSGYELGIPGGELGCFLLENREAPCEGVMTLQSRKNRGKTLVASWRI